MNAILQASVAVQQRRSLFWNVSLRRPVVFSDVSEQPVSHICKATAVQDKFLLYCSTIEISVCCPETSVKQKPTNAA
jgi:hypothetical protein